MPQLKLMPKPKKKPLLKQGLRLKPLKKPRLMLKQRRKLDWHSKRA